MTPCRQVAKLRPGDLHDGSPPLVLAQRRCSPACLGRLPGSISHKKAHMARTPKLVLPPAPSTSARRGRPPKVRAALPGAPAATAAEDAAASPADVAAAGAVESGTSLQSRRGRKPRQEAADAAPALPLEAIVGTAAAEASPAAGGPQPDGDEDSAMPAETALPVSDAAGSGPGAAEHGGGAQAVDAESPSPSLDMPGRAQPAARWDPASDGVTFDWPAIERTAARDGPNQAMAKLLVAARAEGANSRWPL